MKKILMIGNGFDLAHGLPTSYKNFLKFCEIINNFFLYQTVNAETANQNAENYFGEYTTIKQRLRKEFSTFYIRPRACLKNKNCTKRMFYFPFS